MPLTLAHPVAVIPLRRLGLPMSALVLGSMVLDVPLYLGSQRGYEITHSPVGIVTADIVLTLAVLAVWFFVLRDPLVDLSPGAVRARLDPRARLTGRQWLLAIPAASIAACTHIAWDSFTHDDRWGSDHVAWLRTDHWGMAGLKWAQYVSGVVGLVIVIAWALLELRSRRPDQPRPARALGPYALVAAIGIAGATGVSTAIVKVPHGLHSMAFHGVINSIVTAVLAVGVMSLIWRIAVASES
ncbi:DUF4184 family protein [Aeromicrobium panaciterrae]|uniref:DUF4184 family protein n=1 Tax=Aeromicrobium panaciterrae TaxID=363861 RepID=UPI0031E11746